MFLAAIDRYSSVPVYQQICRHVVDLIEAGALQPGDRLPPTRGVAVTLGVHRSTVVRAYDEIRALGYLESRAGSYTTVRRRARPPATRAGASTSRRGLVNWHRATVPAVRRTFALGLSSQRAVATDAAADLIDFERLAADPSLTPDADLRSCLRSALARDGGATLDYADPRGWLPLREMVATRLAGHGVAVATDEILVTNGAQQALDLILRLLTRPGDRVAVEAPTYGLAHALLRLHGVQPVEIPIRHDGMDLAALAKVLRNNPPALVYTMPSFHNPTGVTTDQAHREKLLALCEKARVPIVEDGFEEEMKYFGQAVLPLKSMDARGIVLYVSSFSKVVFPGLRVGWIAAPRAAVERLVAVQYTSCLSGNTLAQAAAARFARSGGFEAYLRRIHRIYRHRMQAMLQGLNDHLPDTATWSRPDGGYTLWLEPPAGSGTEAEWHERFRLAGVKTAPGSRFFARPRRRPGFRLSISCTDEAQIVEGCRRLGRALSRSGRRHG